MNNVDNEERTANLQWEAYVHQNIGGAKWRARILETMAKANWPEPKAKALIGRVVMRARTKAVAGMIGFGFWLFIALAISVGSHAAATSSPNGGTYIIWWGGVLCGGIGTLYSLAKLWKTR